MKNFAKRISALVLAVVVSAAVLCPAAFAAQLPSLPKDQCVVDGAGVLSSSTVQTITELNAQLESSCSGAQIGVLTVEYTGNDSTEDYATQAFNAWGIGSSSKNNGVLILLVMESAQYADCLLYTSWPCRWSWRCLPDKERYFEFRDSGMPAGILLSHFSFLPLPLDFEMCYTGGKRCTQER